MSYRNAIECRATTNDAVAGRGGRIGGNTLVALAATNFDSSYRRSHWMVKQHPARALPSAFPVVSKSRNDGKSDAKEASDK